MYSDNKQIRDVADVAAKIMYGQQPVTEKLHPNQQQLDVHEPEKDELTADDFKKLRGKKEVKKEEVEQQDEAMEKKTDFMDRQKRLAAASTETAKDPERLKRMMKIPGYAAAMGLAKKTTTKEEVEEQEETILEYETDKNGKFVHNAKAGRYGGSEKPQDPFAAVRGPGQKDLAKIEAEKKKKKKFSEMVGLYNEKGLKSLSEMLVKEEPDNEQFTKELEDAKAKSEGKKRNTEIAKGQPIAPIPVKEGWKGAVIGGALGSLAGPAGALAGAAAGHFVGNDMAKSGKDKKVAQTAQAQQQAKQGVKKEDFEERHMSDDEMDKRETIVKGMKKGLAGFKDRYGSRANDVMYATATKQAMK